MRDCGPGIFSLAIDGHELHSAQEAMAQLASHKPGGTVQLRVQRGLKVQEVQCKVVERPSQV